MSKPTTVTNVETNAMYVRARYYVKTTGSIVSTVRSGEHDYITTLNRNGHHTCSCDGSATFHKTCKHIKHCRTIENARAARERRAQELACNEQQLARIARDVEDQIARELAEAAAHPAKESEQKRALYIPTTTAAHELVPLNGNRPFSVLRV